MERYNTSSYIMKILLTKLKQECERCGGKIRPLKESKLSKENIGYWNRKNIHYYCVNCDYVCTKDGKNPLK